MKHTHCKKCLRMDCVERVDDITSCLMINCDNECGARFHSCKTLEHKRFCEKEKVPCLNKAYGCPVKLLRDEMASHLPSCQAVCEGREDILTSCTMMHCPNGCGARYKEWQAEEHKVLCKLERVPCLNVINGCPAEVVRGKMNLHLPVCPVFREEWADYIESGIVVFCENGCGASFESCRNEDHKLLCRKERVPCINKLYGCSFEGVREAMGSHLSVCPAIRKDQQDYDSACTMVLCENGCGASFELRKSEEHKMFCDKEKVPCINQINGCPLEITRGEMDSHLPVCPASVVVCSREWNRQYIKSEEHGWKAPKPLKHPLVRYRQYDVALAVIDQQQLIGWPAASTAPYQLLCGTQLDATTEEAPECLKKAMDSISQRREKLAEFMNAHDKSGQLEGQSGIETEVGDDHNQATNRIHVATLLKADDNKSGSDFDIAQEDDDEQLDIYYEDKTMRHVLGLDLTKRFISEEVAKCRQMFTFQCGREFRRDQFTSHDRNYHCEIQSNLDWFEQRCPLSYAGCTFSLQRFKPKNPIGELVRSSVIPAIGVSKEDEFVSDHDRVDGQLKDDEDLRTVVGRNRLRTATAEIQTSINYGSLLKVVPRYKQISQEINPTMQYWGDEDDTFQHSLTDLPTEILQSIVRNLDSYSIQHLSMTCKRLQSVCCSLLDEMGLVSAVWVKSKPEEVSEGSQLWNIAYKRWFFSTGFTPVTLWEFTEGSSSAVHEHLKICPYNQDEHKNIKEGSYQYIPAIH